MTAISWLDLEQHALGMLGEARAAEVEAALAEDADLRARFDALRADERPVPPLPVALPADSGLPLPAPALALVDSPPPQPEPADSGLPLPAPALALVDSPPPQPELEERLQRQPRRWGALAGFALAAAAALAMVALPDLDAGRLPPADARYKGADLALRIDRARGDAVVRGVDRFADGDRLSVRLSCAPGARPWTAAVFQDGDRFAPLGEGGTLDCGNDRPLPGAFTADGASLAVCVALDGAHDLQTPPGPHATGVVCQRLVPEG